MKDNKPDFLLTPCCNASLIYVKGLDRYDNYKACFKCNNPMTRDKLIEFDPDFYFSSHDGFNEIPECKHDDYQKVVGGNWLFTGEIRKMVDYVNFNVEETHKEDLAESYPDASVHYNHHVKSDYYGWANANHATVAKTYGRTPADVVGWLLVALNQAMDLVVK